MRVPTTTYDSSSAATAEEAMKPQRAFYDEAFRKIAEVNETFMEFVRDGTMTKTILRKLINKRPSLWSRFSAFLETDTLPE